jgi:hypothetical protein
MTNGVVLIVLSDKGTEDATSCNEEEDDEVRNMKRGTFKNLNAHE